MIRAEGVMEDVFTVVDPIDRCIDPQAPDQAKQRRVAVWAADVPK